ncbi:MAG: exo-alpha-sialidase, partial [Phycisphaerales bacterium]|nr:exo-alpha-sialidase [Phycisphaerales bacterium]
LGSDRDVLTASFFIDLSALDPGPLTPPGAISNMATTDVGGDFRVSLASDGEVSWYATWSSTVELSGAIGSDEDIFFARSGDNGTTWTNVIAVSDLALQDSGRDINPVIAFDGECVLVVAWASQSVPGTGAITDYDIFFTRSEDHGLTWSPSARVKTTGASDAGDDGFFDVSLATDGQGTWVCAWDSTDPLSGSGTDYDIMYAVSTDNGVTWGTPRLLNSTAASDTLPDTFCRLATDGNGRWIATWDSFEPIAGSGTDRDIMYAVSTDGGQNWGMASPLGTNAAGDVGEDALPSIAAGRGGRWMAVWQSNDDLGGLGPDFDIVASTSSNGGMTWSAPVPVNTHAPGDPGFDSEPWVATDGTGRWVVAWWSTADVGGMLGPDADVLWSTSRDLGASWSDAAVLNSDADTDVSFERSVRVATNARGTWLAGWESSGDSASPFGADFDVLQARFALAPLCPGDTNGDQTVDFDDLNRVLELWAVTDADPEWDPSVDLVPSGRIDFADLNAVLTAFGTYCD